MPEDPPEEDRARRAGQRGIARALLLSATLTFLVGQIGLWLSIEPVATWSYDLSWWSAILVFDAIVHLRTGSSIAISRPGTFLLLAFWSGVFWLLHECANLRITNWYYVGIPRDLFTRTVGVFLSFATVLPGVLEVHALLSCLSPALSPGARPRARSFSIGAAGRTALFLAGAACLLLPLALPRQAYPLIWGAGFLLLEPWLLGRDPRSLLARFAAGERGPLLRMLAAGLVCGLLWETWNWRSPAKWIYTVPLFERLLDAKLFEMPYLGFLGFVPFALSCHSFARALVVLRWIPE